MRLTSILKIFALATVASLMSSVTVIAQNVEAIPDAPAQRTTPKKRPLIDGIASTEHATQPDGDAVLIPSLKGIIVEEIDSAGGGKSGIPLVALEVHEGTPLPEGRTAEKIAAYLGEPLTFNQISLIRIALADGWRDETGEIIRVGLPPQDITGGVLVLQAVRARLGEVGVRGARYFKKSVYLDDIRLTPGDPLDMDILTGDIDWLERNPYRNVGAVLKQGDGFGKTDILLNVQEQRPWQVFAGYDREGTELLGVDRLFFGGNHGNLFGKGHRATYQFFTDVEFQNQQGHFASYLVPLPWRHEVQVSGFYSNSNVTTASGLNIPGLETITNASDSWQLGLDYIIPFPRFYGGEQDLVFGFDAKSGNSNLDFGVLTLFQTQTEVYHFRGEWRLRRYDRFGATAVRARVVASPGDWSSNNSDPTFNASRFGADSSYVYGGFEYDRQTNLPGGFSLMTSAAYHTSSTNQLASEQLVLSGEGAVRGFERSRIRADRGLLLNAQLNAPGIKCKILRDPSIFTPFVFFDYGMGRSIDRLPGESDVALSSAGAGIRTELTKNLSANFTFAKQLIENGFDDGETGRWHIGVTAKF